MKDLEAITELLGGAQTIQCEPTSEMDFISLVRKGLPVQSAVSAAKSLTLGEHKTFAWLRSSKARAARSGSRENRLRAGESERLLRLVRVAAAATNVLGSRDKAVRWLQKSNRELGGEVPVDLLDTDVGFQAVMDVLQRVEHGVIG